MNFHFHHLDGVNKYYTNRNILFKKNLEVSNPTPPPHSGLQNQMYNPNCIPNPKQLPISLHQEAQSHNQSSQQKHQQQTHYSNQNYKNYNNNTEDEEVEEKSDKELEKQALLKEIGNIWNIGNNQKIKKRKSN